MGDLLIRKQIKNQRGVAIKFKFKEQEEKYTKEHRAGPASVKWMQFPMQVPGASSSSPDDAFLIVKNLWVQQHSNNNRQAVWNFITS